jgi:hypothetical protein
LIINALNILIMSQLTLDLSTIDQATDAVIKLIKFTKGDFNKVRNMLAFVYSDDGMVDVPTRIAIDELIELAKNRLNKDNQYVYHAQLARDREKSGFGM